MKITKDTSYHDFIKIIADTITKRLHKDFPQYFIHCSTRDKEIYNNSNKSGYSYYINIINSLKHGCFENSYKIDDYYEDIKYTERQRLLDSLNNCEDIRIWCFDNIELKH